MSQRLGAAKGLTAAIPQEKVSQLKDEVRLQYEKMHQILDEDLRKTMEILDKAQAKFCNENAAQVLHLNERMQEAKKLLSSVQVMFDKTEDINFMKVRTLCWGGMWPRARFGGVEAWLTMRGWGCWSGVAANISSGFSGAQWDWCRGDKRVLGLSAPPGPCQICGSPRWGRRWDAQGPGGSTASWSPAGSGVSTRSVGRLRSTVGQHILHLWDVEASSCPGHRHLGPVSPPEGTQEVTPVGRWILG